MELHSLDRKTRTLMIFHSALHPRIDAGGRGILHVEQVEQIVEEEKHTLTDYISHLIFQT
ncbi:hypothetical protein JRQ81_003170, partial [Phrynocephalus forsythii]